MGLKPLVVKNRFPINITFKKFVSDPCWAFQTIFGFSHKSNNRWRPVIGRRKNNRTIINGQHRSIFLFYQERVIYHSGALSSQKIIHFLIYHSKVYIRWAWRRFSTSQAKTVWKIIPFLAAFLQFIRFINFFQFFRACLNGPVIPPNSAV